MKTHLIAAKQGWRTFPLCDSTPCLPCRALTKHSVISLMSCIFFSNRSASQRLWVGAADVVMHVCSLLLVVTCSPCMFTSSWPNAAPHRFGRVVTYELLLTQPTHDLLHQSSAKPSWISLEPPALFVPLNFHFSTCWRVQKGEEPARGVQYWFFHLRFGCIVEFHQKLDSCTTNITIAVLHPQPDFVCQNF